MFSDEELRITKDVIQRKQREILNKEGGSDLEYIRNLQTLAQLENACDEHLESER